MTYLFMQIALTLQRSVCDIQNASNPLENLSECAHFMQLSTDSPIRQVGEKFINKVTASFIEDSYEEFAKKELQECCGTKNAQGLRMGDFS